MKRHSVSCDCPTCTERAEQFTLFSAVVFLGLYLAALFAIGRSGLFAWLF